MILPPEKHESGLPTSGWSAERIIGELTEMHAGDLDPSEGLHQGWVYDPGEPATSVAGSAMKLYYNANPLLTGRAFPSLETISNDLVAIACELLHNHRQSGMVTTGGSESNLLGVWSALQLARRSRQIASPNLVIPYSAHPSFDKAAMYFDIEVRRAPLDGKFQVDCEAMAALVDDATVLLVGSAPDYSHGAVDDITQLGQMALQRDLPLHVDACVGGFMLPFVERLGRVTPPWDFRVPGVRSISADVHKHGYGPKGVSVLITDADERVDATSFEFFGWPHGRYVTQTICGTRSGAALAGAWSIFKFLGESGYIQLAREVMEITDRFRAGIEAVDELYVLGNPPVNKFSYAASGLDVMAIADGLAARGWIVPKEADPEAIGMHVGLFHEGAVDHYIEDLCLVVEKVRSGELSRGGGAAAYN